MNRPKLSYPLSVQRPPADADEKPIRFSHLFWNFFQFWPFILAFAILGGIAAKIYLKYKSPVYSAWTKILIKDETSSGQISEATVFEDLGLISRSGNIENEMEILQSVYLMQTVVQNMGIRDLYIKKGSIRDVDVYKACPFEVRSWQPSDTVSGWRLSVDMKPKDERRFEIISDGQRITGEFGKMLLFRKGAILIDWKSHAQKGRDLDDYRIILRTLDDAATAIAGGLSIKSIGKRSTVLELTLQDEVVERARDVLNELTRVYDRTQLLDKNRIYDNTISFIDDRMGKITGELSIVEFDVERFKQANNVVDLSAEGPILMEETNAYDKSISDAEIQLDILVGIRDLLRKNPERFDFIPSNMGINNLTLNGMLESFNQILLEREKSGAMLGAQNPQVKAIDNQLINLRTNIIRNIDALEGDLKITRNALRGKGRQLQNRMRNIPRQERQLVEIQRQQAIKQNLYLYLLQKREESELSRTVAVSNNRVVEPARVGGQVLPVPRNIWALGVGGGFVLPVLLISLLQALNTKVRNVEDIRKHTRVPLLGLINYTSDATPVAVTGKSRTVISEMFRLIRANLQFVGNGEHNKTILVTSSVSGEGKSFVSLNLGITLALAGKKVLLIELDMRNPRLNKMLKLDGNTHPGITQYLVNPEMDWRSIVRQSEHDPGLGIITCGFIPPNPSELLMGDRMAELFRIVREEYEYIILDTAPVGLVSDALLLNRFVDTTLYVVRKDVTELSHLEIIEEAASHGKLPRPYIIMNAVRKRILGYGQGYLYGYGYYQDDRGWKRWLNDLRNKKK